MRNPIIHGKIQYRKVKSTIYYIRCQLVVELWEHDNAELYDYSSNGDSRNHRFHIFPERYAKRKL